MTILSQKTHLFSSVEETQAFAGKLASDIKPGSVLALIGELGSGKTTFAQGFARGMGVNVSVGSPTFKLVSEYDGRNCKLYHVDCYRIEGTEDFLNIDGESLLNPGNAVTLIEWADRIQKILPEESEILRFEHVVDDPFCRQIVIEGLDS